MEENTVDEAVSFWNKTSEDITVGDTLVLTTGIMVVSMAAPLVVWGVWAGAIKIGEVLSAKNQSRKDRKQLRKAVDSIEVA